MRFALYEPDNPRNVGTMIRMAACLGVPVDIIEPCGFPFSLGAVKRGVLDYGAAADVARHADWPAFVSATAGHRLVLMTTRSAVPYVDFAFDPDDVILLGSESRGVPGAVHDQADARLVIPLRPGLRSLNVATAAAMVLGEALRQTGGLPTPAP